MGHGPYINYPGEIAQTIYNVIAAHPYFAQKAWKLTGVIFVIILSLLALYSFKTEQKGVAGKFLKSPFLFMGLATIGIVIFRLPNFVVSALNPDQNYWIVAAAKLLSGGIPWKTVTGGTGGPLLYAPVSLMYYGGFSLNYASLRLFGLVFCIIPSMILVYLTFKYLFNKSIAALLSLPLVFFYAFSNHFDIEPYNSEHVPMLLTALSIWFLVRVREIKPAPLVVFGFVLGCYPYAKLQAIIIGFVIALSALAELFISNKNSGRNAYKAVLLFIIGGLLPSALLLTYLLLAGTLTNFINDYLIVNLAYSHVGLGLMHIAGFRRFFIPVILFDTTPEMRLLYFTYYGLFFLLLLSFLKKIAEIDNKTRRLTVYLFLVACGSYFSVCLPGNCFAHYQLLMVIPFTVLMGQLIGTALPTAFDSYTLNKVVYVLLFVVLGCTLVPLRGQSSLGITYIRNGRNLKLSAVSKEILRYAKPNDRMAVWAWQDNYYVETGLISATYNPHPWYEIVNQNQDNSDIVAYVAELEANPPSIFLDAIAPGSFYFNDRKSQGHENFKKLNDFIESNYKLAAEIDQQRIYVLNSKLKELNRANP